MAKERGVTILTAVFLIIKKSCVGIGTRAKSSDRERPSQMFDAVVATPGSARLAAIVVDHDGLMLQ